MGILQNRRDVFVESSGISFQMGNVLAEIWEDFFLELCKARIQFFGGFSTRAKSGDAPRNPLPTGID